MKQAGYVVWPAIAMLAAVAASPATAQQGGRTYEKLYVFGDSLVDSGNAQAFRAAIGGADPAPAAAGYFDGRFSNGYNFADYLSFAIDGTPATASARGGTNFSVGGAQAAEVAGDASPSFLEQVGLLDAAGGRIESDALVLVTLGGNDVRRQLSLIASGQSPDLAPTIMGMQDGLRALYDRGARNFVVTGIPDIGQIPAVTSLGSPLLSGVGTGLSVGVGAAFSAIVGGIDATPGVEAAFFDLFSFQRRIYANPAAVGLPVPLDTRNACLVSAPSRAPACQGFVYFDPIHPTTDIHRAIANGIVGQLGIVAAPVPEPSIWAMMLLGFGMAGYALRRRRASVRLLPA